MRRSFQFTEATSTHMAPDLTFTRRDRLMGLLIVLLAFALRMVIIVDRARAPNAISAFDPLPQGTDQLTYYTQIAAFREGSFPPAQYFYQPGMSWFLIAASALVRTDNLGVLRILIAALASINGGLFVATVRLAFGHRWVAGLAGVFLAIYPVGAFYDTDFVITSQTTVLISLALFGILWLWRYPRQWAGVVLYGACFGALAITRFEAIALAPVFGLWLIAVRRDRMAILQVAAAALIGIGVTLPIILHNRAGGADYLITPVGRAEIYRGNNRDTGGDYGGGQASRTTTNDYLKYLKNDTLLSPRRFVELELHKVGMYLSPEEPGNNLNYVISGESVSPVLRAIPLDFRILLALTIFGLFALIRDRQPTAALFGLSFLAFMAAILMIWVEARLRTPTILFMIPAATYGLVDLAEHFPVRWHGGPPRVRRGEQDARRRLIPVPIAAAVLILASFANHHLPRPVTVDRLPSSAQPANVVYDQTLELVGWRIREEYSRAGIFEPFRPYVVSLYWQLLKPTDVDYSFSLGLIVDGERLTSFDHPIGMVSYPGTPTSRWDIGSIYVEQVGLAYKQFDGPIGISGDLMLAVYPGRDAGHLLPAEGGASSPTHITLARPAVIWGSGALPDGLSGTSSPIPFGNLLRLMGWSYPPTATVGEPVPFVLGWRTTDHPIQRSYALAVYLLTADDQVAAQADSPPYGGNLLTSSLPVNFSFGDTKQITMPSEPGTYTVYTAVYDYETMDRLGVPNTTGNLLPLGSIEVLLASSSP
jgi:hypothetical protein